MNNIKSILYKNFRGCGDSLTKVDLRKVSIFTGCNSAGKSSAAKAFILLDSYLQDVKNNNNNLIDTPLDFSKVVKLGSFDNVLNRNAKEKGIGTISLGFSIESFFNVGYIDFLFSFVKKEDDFLAQGWLDSLEVCVNDSRLFTIYVVGNRYNIEVHDAQTLVVYYRNYLIGQLAANYRYDSDFEKNESYFKENPYSEFKEDDAQDEKTMLSESIRTLDLHLILEEEKRLIAEGKINKCRLLSESDFSEFTYPNKLNQARVDGIYASVLTYGQSILDVIIAKIESESHRKLEISDIDRVINEYTEFYNKRAELRAKKSYDPEQVVQLARKLFKKNEIVKKQIANLKAYIESSPTCRMEYIRECEIGLIDRLVKDYNIADQYTKDISDCAVNSNGGIGDFINRLTREAIRPDFCGRIVRYIDASTVEVKRLYPVDNANRFGKSWKQFNDICRNNKQEENISGETIAPGMFMQKWLKEFGICEQIELSNVEGAIKIKLISKETPEGRPLADFGYGVTQLVSLLLNIDIALREAKEIDDYEIESYWFNLRYGCAPIIRDFQPCWIIVEEPEVHLHPKFQSKLAEMFLDAANYGVQFIIETHSEYLVRRTQAMVADKGFSAENIDRYNPFKVFYFPEKGSPYDLKYLPSGRFENKFGEGFFDEASKSALYISKLERRNHHG